MNLLGVPTEFDSNEGLIAGASFVPTDLDPNNQTRADARRSYYDPYATRENLHVITGQQVTRIIIDGVAGDQEASNPTSGGSNNGEGPSSGNTGGFGFSPNNPPTPPAGENVRRDPSTSNLRITGVEVRDCDSQHEIWLTPSSLLLMLPHHVRLFMRLERLSSQQDRYIRHSCYNYQE